jgi:predicted metal-dependent hydrolase
MILQKDKVQYGTITIPYQIIKTGRIKTSEVIVDADTITVRTPYNKDRVKIQKLVLGKARWILKKQKEYRETIPQLIKPSFKENTTLPYLGNNYSLVINKEHAKNCLDLTDGTFVATINKSKFTPKLLQKLYENWLNEKAQELFEDKTKKFSKDLGVLTSQIVIKNLRNRWGSLTKNGVLNLNLNLIKAPENVIDYIILHELCHLRIKEHSHHYWDLLHKFMPNYHDKIKWLKLNGSTIL